MLEMDEMDPALNRSNYPQKLACFLPKKTRSRTLTARHKFHSDYPCQVLHSTVGSIHFSCSQTKIPSLLACPTWTRTRYVWKQTSNMTTREPLPQTLNLCWNANSSCPGPGTPSEITRTVSHRNYNCSLKLMLLSCPYPWWLQPSWLQ